VTKWRRIGDAASERNGKTSRQFAQKQREPFLRQDKRGVSYRSAREAGRAFATGGAKARPYKDKYGRTE
jgi:hypothetical protein